MRNYYFYISIKKSVSNSTNLIKIYFVYITKLHQFYYLYNFNKFGLLLDNQTWHLWDDKSQGRIIKYISK